MATNNMTYELNQSILYQRSCESFIRLGGGPGDELHALQCSGPTDRGVGSFVVVIRSSMVAILYIIIIINYLFLVIVRYFI